ncbi:MAG TPA: phosphate ABC transporter substrate-binding protein PstS [Streptosporangiaceae bacterium]
MSNGTRFAALGGVVVAGALALSACGSDNNGPATGSGGGGSAASIGGAACAKGTLTASGSTAQANAMSAWIKNYQQACGGATINYQGVGSGAGIQQFTAGSTGMAGSDSALKPEEHGPADQRCKSGKAIDLPMVGGPIAVVYNLPGVDGLRMSPKNLAGIFSGKITKWNDPAIAKDNPDAKLPSSAIQPFHRSEESGTTDNFTKFLKAAAGGAWTFDPGKKWVAPGGQGAKGSDGIAQAVKQTQGTISYDEYSYATNSRLQTAKVANGSGEFVELTTDSASKGIEAAKIVGQGNDLALSIDYATKEQGAYPVVLVTYEITCEKGLSSDQLSLVRSFLTYTVSDQGQAGLTQLGYAPLPKSLQQKVQAALQALS